MRDSILEIERSSKTNTSDLQLLQQQQQFNEMHANLPQHRIVSSSGCRDEKSGIQQNVQHANASSPTPSNVKIHE